MSFTQELVRTAECWEKMHWHKHFLVLQLLSFLLIFRGVGQWKTNYHRHNITERLFRIFLNQFNIDVFLFGSQKEKMEKRGQVSGLIGHLSSLLCLLFNWYLFQVLNPTEISECIPFSQGNSSVPCIRIKCFCYWFKKKWERKPLYSIWFGLKKKKTLNTVQISGTVLSCCILQQLNILYGISQKYDLIWEHLQQSGTHFPLYLTFSSL